MQLLYPQNDGALTFLAILRIKINTCITMNKNEGMDPGKVHVQGYDKFMINSQF